VKLGEGGRQQAQGGRGQDGAPDALSGPRGDELRAALGEPAKQTEEGKGRQTDDENAAPALARQATSSKMSPTARQLGMVPSPDGKRTIFV
jgi:hypothetical protein